MAENEEKERKLLPKIHIIVIDKNIIWVYHNTYIFILTRKEMHSHYARA